MNAKGMLAALDREFNAPDSEMHVDDYKATRERLLRDAEAEAAAPPAIVHRDDDLTGITRKQLAMAVAGMTIEAIKPLATKVQLDNMRECLCAAIVKTTDEAVAPLETLASRTANLETKVGALSMLAGGRKDTTDALERRIVSLESRLAELEGKR